MRAVTCMILAISVAASALVAVGGATFTSQRRLVLEAHRTRGLSCVQISSRQPGPDGARRQRLPGLRDQAKLPARTAKADPNPHASPHLPQGATQVCSDCHHIHKPSEASCSAALGWICLRNAYLAPRSAEPETEMAAQQDLLWIANRLREGHDLVVAKPHALR